jgi:hypothetical protein
MSLFVGALISEAVILLNSLNKSSWKRLDRFRNHLLSLGNEKRESALNFDCLVVLAVLEYN